MSLARVQNFSISLDGFGTGEGQSYDAPFGHAGHRLHQWMFATRWCRGLDNPGGSAGLDNAFAGQHDLGIGTEIMGSRTFGNSARRSRVLREAAPADSHAPPVAPRPR